MDLLLSVANRFGASSPTRFGQGMRIQRHPLWEMVEIRRHGQGDPVQPRPHPLPKARIGSYPRRDPGICPACGLCPLSP